MLLVLSAFKINYEDMERMLFYFKEVFIKL